MNAPALNNPALNKQALELRDIHLPEPISWWPIAPGWWLIAASLLLTVVIFFIARKIYAMRQLRRDIKAELDDIKQQFQATRNKAQLAKALSVLLRRANITFYAADNIAGLTGKDWLQHLDSTSRGASADKHFDSDIGQTLLNAPYLPDETELDFDAQALIKLSETWLTSPHKKIIRNQAS